MTHSKGSIKNELDVKIAIAKFENTVGRAWLLDTEDSFREDGCVRKATKDAWEQVKTARQELLDFIMKGDEGH